MDSELLLWVWNNVRAYNRGERWASFIWNGTCIHLAMARDGEIWEM